MAPKTEDIKRWMKICGAVIAATGVILGAVFGDIHINPPSEVPSKSDIEARLRNLEILSATDHEAIKHIDGNTTYLRDKMDRFFESQSKGR